MLGKRSLVATMLLFFLPALGLHGPLPTPEGETARAGAVRLNNLGVAKMAQQRFADALTLFEQAQDLDATLLSARVNHGIALLNLQRYAEAERELKEVLTKDPSHPRALYNLALLYKSQGKLPEALEALRKVSEIDPDDKDTQYFLGSIYSQLKEYRKAIDAYQRAIALDPFHVSAQFGLSRAYQMIGDQERAQVYRERFQELTEKHLGAPVSAAYGDQGQYSLAEEVRLPLPPAPAAAAIPVRFVSVASETGLAVDPASKGAASSSAGACFFDYDGDGQPDLFLVNQAPEGTSLLYRNLGNGRFEDVTRAAKLDVLGRGLGCTAGDYDNDGRTDLAVSSSDGVRLFRNQGDGTFRDVTQVAGIRQEKMPAALTFWDFDHDGDLDLYVLHGPRGSGHGEQASSSAKDPSPRNVLWRNNGNATFTDWSEPTGLGSSSAGGGAVATDFNNDRAVDLMVSGVDGTGMIYLNPREGRFQVLQAWDSKKENLPAPVGVIAFDFDKDGWMDLAFTHAGPPGLTLWRNVKGKRLEQVTLPKLDWTGGWGLAALDHDNDGWLDLAAVGESGRGGQIVLLRNLGPAGFADVSAEVGLDHLKLTQPWALIAADYDRDGDTDLLVTQNTGPVVLLRNDGGNKNNWLRLSLKGLRDNKNGIGTKVEVFTGSLYQKWEVQAASGYLGQSATEILAGLGSAPEADIVRLLWPTGVPQDEIQLVARSSQSITELDRRGSSCPILFVWDGTQYAFVSDLIGSGVVGEWTGPGERNTADPDEYVRMEGERVKERSGRLSFRLIEPMEEVTYLDQVRLLAVDHPADTDVYPNERFQPAPPFPEFKIITAKHPRPPRAAWDDEGRDVLALLADRDRRYVTGFRKLPFQGFTQPHALTLDLGDLRDASGLRLILYGLTEYFTATSMFAAYQAGIRGMAPYLEVQDERGGWRRVMDPMGFPAGLYRAMVVEVPLDCLAGLTRSAKIRIITNLEIYWDQILVDTSPQDELVRVASLSPSAADLHFHGYPRALEVGMPGDWVYDYAQVSPTGPYARHIGNYTRYGDVRELLAERDDLFAILSSGDQISLEFNPSRLLPLPEGWKRDFFFYADGFEKDMDFHTAHALTVEPLPFHGMGSYPYPALEKYPAGPAHLAYQLRYNTRRVAPSPHFVFRFDYGRR